MCLSFYMNPFYCYCCRDSLFSRAAIFYFNTWFYFVLGDRIGVCTPDDDPLWLCWLCFGENESFSIVNCLTGEMGILDLFVNCYFLISYSNFITFCFNYEIYLSYFILTPYNYTLNLFCKIS